LDDVTTGGFAGQSARLYDYRRAGEWTDVVETCRATNGMGGFRGDCRTHRASVLVKRGAWVEGEEEALRAVEELRGFNLAHIGPASYELGEIRLRQGKLDAAEDAFLRAHEHGFSPQPGLALLHGIPALNAAAAHARGKLELVVGDAAAAADRLASAQRLWHQVHAPYEAARARELLGEARSGRASVIPARSSSARRERRSSGWARNWTSSAPDGGWPK
jgi:hypothetical protein